jgi:hypothetical protein
MNLITQPTTLTRNRRQAIKILSLQALTRDNNSLKSFHWEALCQTDQQPKGQMWQTKLFQVELLAIQISLYLDSNTTISLIPILDMAWTLEAQTSKHLEESILTSLPLITILKDTLSLTWTKIR